VPDKSTISRLVNRFNDTGSVLERNRSGRPSVLSDDGLDGIRQTLLRSPRKSLRKLSLQSGLSYGSLHKATKILKLHPYPVCAMHEPKETKNEKRSLDLSPPDFYLWVFLKESVYKNNPHTLEELKQNTELCISNVTAETLHRVASDMRKRVKACIGERGGHFQHLM
jgi:hypothetical protein